MKIHPESWFERFIDVIDPCSLRIGRHHGPCLASYGCRWRWFHRLYWGAGDDE